jgi:hypothetical protein
VELRTHELLLLGPSDTTCLLADLTRTSQSQPPRLPPQMTMMTPKPTTVPDRPQVYVHTPQRAVVASCQRHQQRESQTYGIPGCSALVHSHSRQTYRPGTRGQWRRENLVVIYAQTGTGAQRAANSLDDAMCARMTECKRCAKYRNVQIMS